MPFPGAVKSPMALGIRGIAFSGHYQGTSLGMKITIATLAGVTWYNAFELMILLIFIPREVPW
jgi:hypothetical protein